MWVSHCLTSFTQPDCVQVHPCGCKCLSFFPFHGWVTLLWVYGPHLYPRLCRWTLRWVPCLGFCLECCNAQWSTRIFSGHGFLWRDDGGGISGSNAHSSLSLLRTLPPVFHSAVQTDIPTTGITGFPLLHTLLAFPVCRRLHDGHAGCGTGAAHRGFALRFPNSDLITFSCVSGPSVHPLWRTVCLQIYSFSVGVAKGFLFFCGFLFVLVLSYKWCL